MHWLDNKVFVNKPLSTCKFGLRFNRLSGYKSAILCNNYYVTVFRLELTLRCNRYTAVILYYVLDYCVTANPACNTDGRVAVRAKSVRGNITIYVVTESRGAKHMPSYIVLANLTLFLSIKS